MWYVSSCMNLWGVAVLELDSHPDHNKGPDHAPCDCPKTHPKDASIWHSSNRYNIFIVLAMTLFGSSIEADPKLLPYIKPSIWYKAYHGPSIEPITFPCRADGWYGKFWHSQINRYQSQTLHTNRRVEKPRLSTPITLFSIFFIV